MAFFIFRKSRPVDVRLYANFYNAGIKRNILRLVRHMSLEK